MFPFVVLLLCFAALAQATLHCQSQTEAVTALRDACLSDLGCRWYFSGTPPTTFSDLVVNRLQLVRDWTDALTALSSSFHGDDDVRRFFWPDGWRTNEPTLVSFKATADLLQNCTGLTTLSSAPPPELRDAVHMLVEYEIFLAQDRQCKAEGQVEAIDPASGNVYCMTTTGQVCASSTSVDTKLVTANYVLGFVLLAAMLLAVIFTTVLFARRHLSPPPLSDDTSLLLVSHT